MADSTTLFGITLGDITDGTVGIAGDGTTAGIHTTQDIIGMLVFTTVGTTHFGVRHTTQEYIRIGMEDITTDLITTTVIIEM